MLLKIAVAGSLVIGLGFPLAIVQQTQTEDSKVSIQREEKTFKVAKSDELIMGQGYLKRSAKKESASPSKETPRYKATKKVSRSKTTNKKVSRSSSVRSIAPSTGSNRRIGKEMAAERGWTGDQWTCLNNLWTKESGWSTRSSNSSGTAWGIPQALPGSKMSSEGSDWRTNPRTQIRWGFKYIKSRYGSPCKAWSHFMSHNWY